MLRCSVTLLLIVLATGTMIVQAQEGDFFLDEPVDADVLYRTIDQFDEDDLRLPFPVSQASAQAAADYYSERAPLPAIAQAGAVVRRDPRPLEVDGRLVGWITDLWPRGFLVTAGDHRHEPIIAFSTEDNFPIDETGISMLRDILAFDLPSRIDASNLSGNCDAQNNLIQWVDILDETGVLGQAQPQVFALASYSTMAMPSDYDGPDPIIDFPSNWHQGSPCNDDCPPCGTQRFQTGCVPLAMAQIFYHHRIPSRVDIDGQRVSVEYVGYPTCSTTGVSALCGAARESLNPHNVWPGCSTGVDADPHVESTLEDAWGYDECTTYYDAYDVMDSDYQILRGDLGDYTEPLPGILFLKGDNTPQHAVVYDGYKREQKQGEPVAYWFHLRMGDVNTGVNVWYNLPSSCIVEQYNAVTGGVAHIKPPDVEIETGACWIDLHVDRPTEGYASGSRVVVTADTDRSAVTTLYVLSTWFASLGYGTPWNIPAAGDGHVFPDPLFAGPNGVETIAIIAEMGTECCAVDVASYLIGTDTDMLDAARITSVGCTATQQLTVRYSVDDDFGVSSVWLYLLCPEHGLASIGHETAQAGSFDDIDLEGISPGERVLILVVDTARGVLSTGRTFQMR